MPEKPKSKVEKSPEKPKRMDPKNETEQRIRRIDADAKEKGDATAQKAAEKAKRLEALLAPVGGIVSIRKRDGDAIVETYLGADQRPLIETTLEWDSEDRRHYQKSVKLVRASGEKVDLLQGEIQKGELETLIASKQFYDLLEQLLWSDMTNEKVIQRTAHIRAIGKKLYGIDTQEASIRTMHPSLFLKTEGETEVFVKPFSMQELARQMPLLQKQLEKYPPDFFDQCRLEHLYPVKTVKTPSMTDGFIPTGLGYSSRSQLGISAVIIQGEKMGRALDHELAHAVEHQLDFTQNANRKQPRISAEFAKLQGIDAGNMTDDRIDRTYEAKYNPIDYASSYGAKSPREDFAEIVRMLFDPSFSLELGEKMRRSPILRKKVAIVQQYYYVFSDGKMDMQLWEDVRSGQSIDQTYWKGKKGAIPPSIEAESQMYIRRVMYEQNEEKRKTILAKPIASLLQAFDKDPSNAEALENAYRLLEYTGEIQKLQSGLERFKNSITKETATKFTHTHAMILVIIYHATKNKSGFDSLKQMKKNLGIDLPEYILDISDGFMKPPLPRILDKPNVRVKQNGVYREFK